MLSINAGLISGSKLEPSVSGGVGVYIDLPKLTAKFTALQNVNDKCLPDSSKQNSEYIQVDLVLNLTLVPSLR